MERPSSLMLQSCTFSAYKNKNTVKVHVGVTPSEVISFMSECYERSISDKRLVEVSLYFYCNESIMCANQSIVHKWTARKVRTIR